MGGLQPPDVVRSLLEMHGYDPGIVDAMGGQPFFRTGVVVGGEERVGGQVQADSLWEQYHSKNPQEVSHGI